MCHMGSPFRASRFKMIYWYGKMTSILLLLTVPLKRPRGAVVSCFQRVTSDQWFSRKALEKRAVRSLHQLVKILHYTKLRSCWAQLRTWCCRRGSVQPVVIAGCVATSRLSCYDWHVLNFQLKLHFANQALHDASLYHHTGMHLILILGIVYVKKCMHI